MSLLGYALLPEFGACGGRVFKLSLTGFSLSLMRARRDLLKGSQSMKYSYLTLACAGFVLAACTGPVIMGSDAAVMYISKPGDPPPADITKQIPPHESWCYSTMGDTTCYAHPQDVPPGRLVNVDPQSRYPIDLQAYHDALAGKPAPAIGGPVMLEPAAAAQVEKATLSDELGSPAVTPSEATP